jgi:hypothetical protein
VIAPGLSVRPVYFDDFDAPSPQEPTEPSSIGPRPFDADLGHLSEGLEPAEQCLVAGGISTEGLGSDQAPERIKCGGNVIVQVGVDASGDPGRGFYDGHGYPFLLNG